MILLPTSSIFFTPNRIDRVDSVEPSALASVQWAQYKLARAALVPGIQSLACGIVTARDTLPLARGTGVEAVPPPAHAVPGTSSQTSTLSTVPASTLPNTLARNADRQLPSADPATGSDRTRRESSIQAGRRNKIFACPTIPPNPPNDISHEPEP